MEAEFFAAQIKRSAPDGRALLCAAVYARKIQGSKASHNLSDARNRAPQPPFRRATEGSRGAKEGLGCQEGKGNHRCPVPSCLRRESPAFLRRGHGASRPPKAANAHAHSERKVAFSGAPLYRRKYTLC